MMPVYLLARLQRQYQVVYIYIYIYIYDEMVDFGESDKMIKIRGKRDKSST